MYGRWGQNKIKMTHEKYTQNPLMVGTDSENVTDY